MGGTPVVFGARRDQARQGFFCRSVRLSQVVAALWLLAAAANIAFADVWIADEKALYKLDAATNQIALRIASSKASALSVDPGDGGLWVLGEDALSKRSSTGALLFQLNLKVLGLEGAKNLALDTREGSIWVGKGRPLSKDDGGHQSTFVHLDRAGRVLGMVPALEEAADIAVALDQSVWILGRKRLLHYTTRGSLLADIDLKPVIDGEPKLLEVDSIGAWVWVAAERRITRIDAQSPSTQPLSVPLPLDSQAIALDAILGSIWVSSDNQLLSVDSTGALAKSIDLKALRINEAKVLAFDPVTRSVLVGHDIGLTRFSQSGANPFLIATHEGVMAIGVSPLTLETLLTVSAPTSGQLSNKPLLPITLQLKILCSGSDCGFAGGFYHGYTLSVLLNGREVGASFVIDPSTGVATYVPPTRYPEGANIFTAIATDNFGQVSNPASSTFTLDTIPPSFLALLPISPQLTNQRLAHISGRLSEPSTLVIGSAAVAVAGDNTFAYDLTLSEGSNTVVLLATDLAGNAASQSLSITLDTIPPKFTNVVPVDGAAFGTANVTISGNVDEAAAITLSWSGAAQSANGTEFHFPVTLAPGVNALQLSAIDKAGNTSPKSINVAFVPVTVAVATPADASSITTDAVLVSGTYTGPPNTRVSVNGVDAGSPNNTFSLSVPLVPGANTITVTATSPDGATASSRLQVTRDAASPPPTITFYSPNDGDSFAAPATIYVRVGAVNADGTSSSSVTVSNDSPVGFSIGIGESGFAEYFWMDVPDGIYTVNAQVTDGNGVTGTKSITITVTPDPAEKVFRDIWNGFVGALRAGDKVGAQSFLTDGAKDLYAPVFATLMPDMGAIFDSVQSLRAMTMGEEITEFAVTRLIDGEQQIFFMYFVKDGTGQWKLDSL